ncbi:MAG TPA: nucleotidyltransferase substrate binding protein [Ignavibacteriaceae bacterium]|nr:nucleotidyltransferase substrate binding protein [Ignavibacteriaceae bacterium]
MKTDYRKLLEKSKEKVISAVDLVEASLLKLERYDERKNYTPKQLEPYDALSDRFIRAVESCIKFFKTYEYYLNAAASGTFRDLLLNMQKQNLISSLEIWIDMRDIRNRIVHEYLPHEVKNIYDLIMGEFKDEILTSAGKIKMINPE